jgi:hypothetical protein
MLCVDCIGKYIAFCVKLSLVNEVLKSQYLNENSALACSPWIDETVGFNTSAMLTLSLTEHLAVVIMLVV